LPYLIPKSNARGQSKIERSLVARKHSLIGDYAPNSYIQYVQHLLEVECRVSIRGLNYKIRGKETRFSNEFLLSLNLNAIIWWALRVVSERNIFGRTTLACGRTVSCPRQSSGTTSAPTVAAAFTQAWPSGFTDLVGSCWVSAAAHSSLLVCCLPADRNTRDAESR
jgi:hypothetical protein